MFSLLSFACCLRGIAGMRFEIGRNGGQVYGWRTSWWNWRRRPGVLGSEGRSCIGELSRIERLRTLYNNGGVGIGQGALPVAFKFE